MGKKPGVNILGVSTSLARTGAIFYISGFVALSHPCANEERKPEGKKCNARAVVARQRRYVKTWIPDTALYTRLSALIRGESARPRDHCYPDVLAREEKREEWRTCRLHPYEGKRGGGGEGEDRRMWGRLHVVGTRYLQRTRRNSATRLSDPHDLTHTEDATTRRPR